MRKTDSLDTLQYFLISNSLQSYKLSFPVSISYLCINKEYTRLRCVTFVVLLLMQCPCSMNAIIHSIRIPIEVALFSYIYTGINIYIYTIHIISTAGSLLLPLGLHNATYTLCGLKRITAKRHCNCFKGLN